jgi:N-acetylmuramoyl-L-alanine amidase
MPNFLSFYRKNHWSAIVLVLILCLFLDVMCVSLAFGSTAKDKYIFAENCVNKLRKSSIKQKYRQFWLTCIDSFKSVYEHDPQGAWAAAGLYQSGLLYLELYKRSYRPADKEAGFDAFFKIVDGYPKSRYKSRSIKALKAAGGEINSTLQAGPEVRKKMVTAKKAYDRLKANSRYQKYRDKWFECIEKFQAVLRTDPKGPLAPEALYIIGELYMGLYTKSYLGADKDAGKKFFEEVAALFPQSSYGKKAQQFIDKESEHADDSKEAQMKPAEQKQAALDRIARMIAESEKRGLKKEEEKSSSNKTNVVSNLRHWSNPNYTRIVIDAEDEADYKHRLLKKDETLKKPERLYIDLERSRLGTDIKRHIAINDSHLIDVRAGQYTSSVVRVVVDIKTFKTYKIFSLKNPFRIVVDVWGTDVNKGDVPYNELDMANQDSDISKGTLARSLALGVRRIIIDPGHGGKDYGAPGYYKGVYEKDITLQIGERLANMIKEKLGCQVIMTRSTDKYLTLEERTAIANTQNADLFVSIHTNSARNRRAYGIETYFLNLATDDEAVLVAARENATSAKNISDLESILTGLMQNAKINESNRLAGYVQQSLYAQMSSRYSSIKDKGVKQAPFYVLLGAQMPAILVETSFISNARECKRLMNAGYQELLCQSIISGIEKYIQALNPTAYYYGPSIKEVGG